MELSRNLTIESVARLGPTAPHAVRAGGPVAEAVAVLRQVGVGCVLVTEAGRLVGVFTERDLLTRVLAVGLSLDTPLRRVMTADPVSVGLNEPIRQAIRRMQSGGYRHLPVIDGEGRPVGVVSAKRVIRYIAEHFPHVVYNLSPGRGSPEAREGA